MISASKSKVIHIRTKSVEKSKEISMCGEITIEYIHQYKYLCLIFTILYISNYRTCKKVILLKILAEL